MQDISKLTSKNRVASSRDREIGCFSCATYSSECGACILYTIIVTLERKWPGCTFEGCGFLRAFTSIGKHTKMDTRWSSYIYTMFSFNLETRVTEILATKLSSVYSTRIRHLSLSLLSENYDDAPLFFVLHFVKDFFTIIECNFTWKNKEEILLTIY